MQYPDKEVPHTPEYDSLKLKDRISICSLIYMIEMQDTPITQWERYGITELPLPYNKRIETLQEHLASLVKSGKLPLKNEEIAVIETTASGPRLVEQNTPPSLTSHALKIMGYQQEKRFQGRLVPNKNQLLTKALPDLPYRERVEMPNEAKGPGR